MAASIPEKTDILIAGAGLSGLYVAYRLSSFYAKQGIPKTIVLAEYSKGHVGGRINTRKLETVPNVPVEAGGMRFLPSHLIVSRLASLFGLPTETFPLEKDPLFYLRTKRIRASDFADSAKVPYTLPEDEQGKTPAQLFNYAVDKIVPGGVQFDYAKWCQTKRTGKYSGNIFDTPVNLYDMGYWNALFDVLSNEGYNLAKYGGGYTSNVINWNLAEALPYQVTDFTGSSPYMRFTNGYSSLPGRLLEEAKSQSVIFAPDSKLSDFSIAPGGGVACSLLHSTGTRTPTTAQQLFLAMPPGSMAGISQDNDFFGDLGVRWCLESVIRQPAFKLFLIYEKAWWAESPLSLQHGPTTTDLPLRQTYYFGSDPGTGNAVLMASYDDMDSEHYWRTLAHDTPWESPPSDDTTTLEGGGVAPKQIVSVAQQQLKAVHGVDIPDPIDSWYVDWGLPPYQAGYHAWQPNYRAWEVMNRVRHPLADWPVYICGSAFSNAQAWVEGALMTAESILTDPTLPFRIPRLDGIPDDYDLIGQNCTNPSKA